MYLRILDSFPDHPKTLSLARVLGDLNAGMYCMRLWTWASKSAKDGDLSNLDPLDLELIMRWQGEPGRCFAAMVAVRFIDQRPGGGFEIHEWAEHTGGDIEKMEERAAEKRADAAERKRQERQRKAAARDSHAPVTRDIGVTVTPGHDPRQGKARQDETSQIPSANGARAGDPTAGATTPGPVALAHAVAVAVEQAGELVAAQAPPLALVRGGGRLTGYDLVQLFGRVRADCVEGCSPWDTPTGNSLQKADAFVASLREENAPLVEGTMREFFRQAQDQTARPPPNPLRRSRATFGFGAWLGDFPDLCQEVRGNRKAPGKGAGPKYCAFHGRERSAGQRAPKHEWRADCPECKHVDARSNKRESEPTSLGEMFHGFQPGG